MHVGDAETMQRFERERSPLTSIPGTITEYLDLLFSSWRSDHLYALLVTETGGWARRGGETSHIPRSYATILKRTKQVGLFDTPPRSVLSRTKIPLNGHVLGYAHVDIPTPE